MLSGSNACFVQGSMWMQLMSMACMLCITLLGMDLQSLHACCSLGVLIVIAARMVEARPFTSLWPMGMHVVTVLEQACCLQRSVLPLPPPCPIHVPTVVSLIEPSSPHPGAGSYYVDGAF